MISQRPELTDGEVKTLNEMYFLVGLKSYSFIHTIVRKLIDENNSLLEQLNDLRGLVGLEPRPLLDPGMGSGSRNALMANLGKLMEENCILLKEVNKRRMEMELAPLPGYITRMG